MQTAELETKIKEIVEDVLEYKLEGNSYWDQQISTVGISSIAYVTILVKIESEFGFEFDEEHLDNRYFKTLWKLLEYVREINK